MSNCAQKPRVRVVQPEIRPGDYVRYCYRQRSKDDTSGACGIVLAGVPFRTGMVRVQYPNFESVQHVYEMNLVIIDEREWAVYAASLALGVGR